MGKVVRSRLVASGLDLMISGARHVRQRRGNRLEALQKRVADEPVEGREIVAKIANVDDGIGSSLVPGGRDGGLVVGRGWWGEV